MCGVWVWEVVVHIELAIWVERWEVVALNIEWFDTEPTIPP
jgi:hypothetical protein